MEIRSTNVHSFKGFEPNQPESNTLQGVKIATQAVANEVGFVHPPSAGKERTVTAYPPPNTPDLSLALEIVLKHPYFKLFDESGSIDQHLF